MALDLTSPPNAAGAPGAQDLRAQAQRFWAARTPSERSTIALMGVVVVCALVWWIALAPALRIVRAAPAEIALLDRQLQQMQLAAAEAQTLRGTVPVGQSQAVAALQAATERLGPSGKVVVQGERVTVTFTAVPAEALRAWLNEARSGARARPVEAQWAKAGDGYSGSVVVLIGGPG